LAITAPLAAAALRASAASPSRVDRAGGRQGAELAQRVAGEVRGERPAGAAPGGEAGAEDRRLRVGGALAGERKRVGADLRQHQLEQLGLVVGDRLAHARCLAPLPGE